MDKRFNERLSGLTKSGKYVFKSTVTKANLKFYCLKNYLYVTYMFIMARIALCTLHIMNKNLVKHNIDIITAIVRYNL